MNESYNFLEEFTKKIVNNFTPISKDDFDSIVYELLKVKNLEDYLIVLKEEINLDGIFVLILRCELNDENHTIQRIFQILKEAWSFVSYDRFEASEIIINAGKMEFKFVSTSNSNEFFSGKIIISGELYEKSYKKYLEFIENLNK
jgi:hypothetical protein